MLQERLGVGDGAVVVGLGGAVRDGVAPRGKPVEKPGVADVAHDELDSVQGQPGDVLPPPRVGQLVQHGHMHARMALHHVPHEVRPNEPAAACNEDTFGIEVNYRTTAAGMSRGADRPVGGILGFEGGPQSPSSLRAACVGDTRVPS